MDGIYTLWSRPSRRAHVGLTRLEKLLLAVSALQWSALHGRAVLYCDTPYAHYLDKAGLLGLFDEINTATLDAADTVSVDPTAFWSFGRILALRDATVPFFSVDCDLIVWRNLTNTIEPGQIIVTHWESTEPSPWYPEPRELATPPGYVWNKWAGTRRRAANVSLLYVGDENFRDRYVNEVLRFAIDNPALPRPDLGVAPELLFADQRLLPLVAQSEGLTVNPAIRAVWSPALDRFIVHDPRFGQWDPLSISDQRPGITHAWFYKRLLPATDPRRHLLVSSLSDLLHAARPDIAARILTDAIP